MIKLFEMQKSIYVECFVNWDHFFIGKYKNTCGGVLISVKVARWSAASLKLTLLPQMMQIDPNPK